MTIKEVHKQQEEHQTLEYAGWLCKNGRWCLPGITVKMNLQRAVEVQRNHERALGMIEDRWANEHENSLSP